MTISTLSIPFASRTQTGFLSIKVLSYNEFMNLSDRVNTAASSAMGRAATCAERSLFKFNKGTSLLLLSRKIYLNISSRKLVEGELSLVTRGNHLFIGFLPNWTENDTRYNKFFFYHHRLDSFSEPPEKIGVSNIGSTLFTLPSLVKLERGEGGFSLCNLHLMLLSENGSNNCALLCSKEPFPPIMPVPILYPKDDYESISDDESSHIKEIEIPFLMGRRRGLIRLPIWTLDTFQKRANSILSSEQDSTGHPLIFTSFIKNCLFVCTKSLSFHPRFGLNGGQLVLIRNAYSIDIGFIPEKGQIKRKSNYFVCSHPSTLELHSIKRNFLSAERASRFLWNESGKICPGSESGIGSLSAISIFLLANENGENLSVLCMEGSFELKNSDPTNPEAVCLSIEEYVDTDSSGEQPEKKSRQEKEGESSQAARAALVAFNQQKEAAAALLLLSGQEEEPD